MRAITKPFLMSVLTLATLVLSPSSVFAQEVECRGALRGTFEAVIVPDGATCILVLSSVTGGIEVGVGSVLITLLNRIGEGVTADEARAVVLYFDSLAGGVEAAGTTGLVRICGVTIQEGEIVVEGAEEGATSVEIGGANPDQPCAGNRLTEGGISVIGNSIPAGRVLSVIGNQVGGDVEIVENLGGGAKRVRRNRIAGEIVCEGNAPPFIGVPNTAGEGVCDNSGGGDDALPSSD